MSYLFQYFGMRRNTRGKILIGYHEGGNGSNKVKNHCTRELTSKHNNKLYTVYMLSMQSILYSLDVIP